MRAGVSVVEIVVLVVHAEGLEPGDVADEIVVVVYERVHPLLVLVGLLGADMYFSQSETNIISQRDGFVLLFFFAVFLYYIASISKSEENTDSGIKKYSN